ncbi:PREDICTED: uncharacterized protein LOC109473439 [Branchiostoma belcheri]|uniref:Uncharacterized protein LOC109473439 n=1 Tax=Branchiostoma belcheri TaxID=7741 RepID=A0A6P4YX36_BRABE|nr:PREDICTED: uncharacterized protein LOC109473439 [Branchiostoma belcheri]
MKTTKMLMTCRWVLLLVVLERTVLEAAPAGRVTRSEEDAPTSTSARQAARRRHNCMPPWSRQCQTSDLIIFKRSLEEQDLPRIAAVSSDSNSNAAAVSSEADSTNSSVESSGRQENTPASLR